MQTTLFEAREEMSLFGKVFLTLAITESKGDDTQRERLVQDLLNHAAVEAAGVHFLESLDTGLAVTWHSDTRTTALILFTLLRADPENQLIPRIAQWLVTDQRNGRWRNTQENAFCAMAMLEYVRLYEKDDPNFLARIFFGGDLIVEQPFVGRSQEVIERKVLMSEIEEQGDNPLIVSKEGAGRLYYSLRLTYAPAEKMLPPREEGFSIQRTYEDLESGEKLDNFKAGEMVKVRLTITTPKKRHYIAIHDPIPAGLEPVNLSFKTASPRWQHELQKSEERDDNLSWYSWFAFNHVDQRDDCVNIFADSLYPGVYEYVYVARATTFGTFSAAPTHVEEMYTPEVFGRTATRIVTVD